MSRVHAAFLRRQTRNPAGDATGGGETGFDPQPQIKIFSKILTGTQTKSVVLPKGTIITAGLNIPAAPADGDSHAVASAGDITIGTTDGGTQYLGSTAVENYTRTAISNGAILSAETRVYFAAVGVVGYTRAAIEVILPLIKP